KSGGGGAWLVGSDGLMANIQTDGTLGPGYDLGRGVDLRGITCRGDEAFVVGDGTFLRTHDAGATWTSLDVGTASLRAVRAAGDPVVTAGDDGVRLSRDDGDTWATLAPGAFVSVAIDDAGTVALAVAADGGLWRWDGAAIAEITAMPGARAVALSHD